MKKGGSVINHLPAGFGGNGEAIFMLEMASKGSARHTRWIGGVIMCSPPSLAGTLHSCGSRKNS